jgi:large subunit ribosomal protein L1|tara:strand:+ start:334 stop:1026 length:693 start_codon:yes stop_codon:yes gene_type:complete
MKRRSKRYKKLKEQIKDNKVKNFEAAISEIKKMQNPKLLESIDVSFKVNLKKIKGSENSLRTVIELPNGNGKKIKVAVLCDDNKMPDAKKSGADVIGSDDLIKKISSGEIQFDRLVCTPNMMPKIAKLGKILGPKGLMPNPKLGTVSDNIVETVNKLKNKFTEIKNDKDGNIGVSIGRKTFEDKKLLENFKILFDNLKKEKPTMFNSEIIKNIYISSTIGPSLKLNFKDI